MHTLVVARRNWGMAPAEIADEWDLSLDRVEEALAFADAHKTEIDAALAVEDRLERGVA